MAQIEALFRAHLVATAAVTALSSTRIYPLATKPQDAALANVTYQLIDRAEVMARPDLVGVRLVRARIQVDAYASSYANQKTLEAALVQALYAFRNYDSSIVECRVVDCRDLASSEESVWRSSLDLSVTYNE